MITINGIQSLMKNISPKAVAGCPGISPSIYPTKSKDEYVSSLPRIVEESHVCVWQIWQPLAIW
jgi:hypothetical protein